MNVSKIYISILFLLLLGFSITSCDAITGADDEDDEEDIAEGVIPEYLQGTWEHTFGEGEISFLDISSQHITHFRKSNISQECWEHGVDLEIDHEKPFSVEDSTFIYYEDYVYEQSDDGATKQHQRMISLEDDLLIVAYADASDEQVLFTKSDEYPELCPGL